MGHAVFQPTWLQSGSMASIVADSGVRDAHILATRSASSGTSDEFARSGATCGCLLCLLVPFTYLAAILEGELAGAGGFEPPPSSLTVRCPTDWTTPQQPTR